MKTQHTFVAECFARYEEEGAHPGDGGRWDSAHYPAPRGLGEQEIALKHNDHQVQGLLQSVEYGRCCFFSGDTARFLKNGPFVDGWFELWDIYETFLAQHLKVASSAGGKASAAQLSPEERSERSRRAGRAAIAQSSTEQRSERVRCGRAKLTQEQRSEIIRKGHANRPPKQRAETVRKSRAKLTPEQRSEAARRGNAKLTPEQRSERSRKANCARRKPVRVTHIETGLSYLFASATEAAEHLQLNRRHIGRVANGQVKHHKGFVAEWAGPDLVRSEA